MEPVIKVYGISDAARLSGYTPESLRRLAASGVVTPVRDSEGRRLFSEADLAKLRAHKNRQHRA